LSSEHIAKLENMPYERSLAENGNSKWLPSMKTKQIYMKIWSAFWKHGWILLKLGMQVSIEF
jgi:hypothetical protein